MRMQRIWVEPYGSNAVNTEVKPIRGPMGVMGPKRSNKSGMKEDTFHLSEARILPDKSICIKDLINYSGCLKCCK